MAGMAGMARNAREPSRAGGIIDFLGGSFG
jgi:hypothetical protein